MSVSIQESFVLPSEGKLYNPHINPKITLRSMTVLEEKKRLGNTNNQFELLASVIDDCIENKESGFSTYDLTPGDFQYLLFKLRTVTYGNIYNINLRCPFCGHAYTNNIDLDSLTEMRYKEGMEDKLNVQLPKSGDTVTLKLLTPRASDTVENRAKELLKKNPDYVGDATYVFTLMAVIDTVNGEKLADAKKQKYVEKLVMADANFIKNTVDSLKLGVNTHCDSECPNCKNTFPFLLPFTSEFLGPTV